MFKPLKLSISIWMALLIIGLAADPAQAIKVGITPAAPYAMKNDKGEWEGICIDLWEAVTAKLDVRYEYQECDYADLVKKLEEGTLDVGIGRLFPLELHISRIDFTHAFFFSGLAIAVPQMTETQHWLAVWNMLRENNLFLLVFLILLTLILSGASMWLLERRHRTRHFSKNLVKGIGTGIWWASATIFTVGYGDKVPGTFWGRLLAILWMIGGIVLVSVFTATITSVVTVNRMQSSYEHLDDLGKKRLCAITGSSAEVYLRKTGINFRETASTSESLKLLSEKGADMVIDDEATLKYYCRREKVNDVRVLPQLLVQESCAFALTRNSPLRDSINQAIKEYISLPNWRNVLVKYLGS